MLGDLKSTFISLIPKKDMPEHFYDFRPIDPCNLVYKMVTKIIANRIKPKLFEVVSKQQFGFLSNRQILDAIGVSQQFLHLVKVKKLSCLIMKVDLAKSYDKVNWVFLRLILLHIGLPVEFTNWILVCVYSVNFVVLANGSPTSFFCSSRGLRQGFPLLPYYFYL